MAEDEAEVTEINKADEANLTDDADAADKAIATVDIKFDDLDEVDEANEIVEAAEVNDSDEVIESNEADEIKEAIALDNEVVDAGDRETNKADPSVVANEFDWIDDIGTADDFIMTDEVVFRLLILFECDWGSTCSLRN